MSTSRFSEVKLGIANFIAALTDPNTSAPAFNTARAILAGQLTTIRPATGSEYPAAYVGLLSARKVAANPIGGPSHISLEYECELGIVIHVNSDGTEAGEVHDDDWYYCDLLMTALAPHILSSPNFTAWPPSIGDPGSIMVELGHSAIYLPVNIKIQWTT